MFRLSSQSGLTKQGHELRRKTPDCARDDVYLGTELVLMQYIGTHTIKFLPFVSNKLHETFLFC
jgi:hypothetical protein